jgi:hypothetical protein
MKNVFDPDYIIESQEAAISEAKAPLRTVEECFLALGIDKESSFPKIQEAYRDQLYNLDLLRVHPAHGSYEYKSAMLKKVKDAYKRICEELEKNPEKGVEETVSSLTAARTRLLEQCKSNSCATSAMTISHEYDERIRLLKSKR